MEDKQAIELFRLAAKLVSTIPAASPIKTLKYQARRLLNLPDQSSLFSQSELVLVVSTIFPVIYCIKKIVSYDQIRFLLNAMENGDQQDAQRDDTEQGNSEIDGKPN